MHHLRVGAALLLALMLCATPGLYFTALIGVAQAQDAVTVTTDAVEVSPDALAPETTVLVNEPTGDTVVTIPAEDIISKVLDWARDIVITGAIAGVGWAGRLLPRTVVNWMMQEIVNRNLVPAIDWGINQVKDATRGSNLSVDVGSQVAAEALQYFIDNAPGWVIKWAGGEDAIRNKIIARIPLDSEATAEKIALAVGRAPRF